MQLSALDHGKHDRKPARQARSTDPQRSLAFRHVQRLDAVLDITLRSAATSSDRSASKDIPLQAYNDRECALNRQSRATVPRTRSLYPVPAPVPAPCPALEAEPVFRAPVAISVSQPSAPSADDLSRTFDHERLDVYQCALSALDLCHAVVDQMLLVKMTKKGQLRTGAGAGTEQGLTLSAPCYSLLLAIARTGAAGRLRPMSSQE